MHWPRKNPFNKRWFQRMTARRLTLLRQQRLAAMYRRWEPRLWAKGVNIPAYLLSEKRRIDQLIESGACDWTSFPDWVRKEVE